jgi:hypothetical protein
VWAQIHSNSGPAINSPLATAEFFTDVSGRPLLPSGYIDVVGSPFLADEWQPAHVLLHTGRSLTGIQVKLDLLKQELYYKDEAGKEMIAKKGIVRELHLYNSQRGDSTHYRSGYPLQESRTAATLYQVLAPGRVALLKHTTKIIQEVKRFNSATTEREFVQKSEYFVYDEVKRTLLKVKKDKKAMLETLAPQAAGLEQFLQETRNKCRTEEDLIAAVNFCNAR